MKNGINKPRYIEAAYFIPGYLFRGIKHILSEMGS